MQAPQPAPSPTPAPITSTQPSAPSASVNATSQPQALQAVPKTDALTMPGQIETLHDVIQMLNCANEVVLASAVSFYTEPVKVEDGLLELGLRDGAGQRIRELSKTLTAIHGKRWIVSFVPPQGKPTPSEENKAAEEADYNAVLNHPDVQQVLTTFPGAKLTKIHDKPTQ